MSAGVEVRGRYLYFSSEYTGWYLRMFESRLDHSGCRLLTMPAQCSPWLQLCIPTLSHRLLVIHPYFQAMSKGRSGNNDLVVAHASFRGSLTLCRNSQKILSDHRKTYARIVAQVRVLQRPLEWILRTLSLDNTILVMHIAVDGNADMFRGAEIVRPRSFAFLKQTGVALYSCLLLAALPFQS